MAVELKVPSLGESVSSATVARWLKNPGDAVAADEPLVELETDKVTVAVGSPVAGVLTVCAVAAGAEVIVGSLLGEVSEGGAVGATPAKPATTKPAPVAVPVAAPAHAPLPAAQKMMTERGVSASQMGDGSGKDGRITKGDVLAFAQKPPAAPVPAPAAQPAAPRTPDAREERVKMTRLRRTIAERLKTAQNTAAMLTTFNEIDMTAAQALRSEFKEAFEKKYGARLGFMSLFVRATINALREFPAVNAEIDGDEIIYKNYVHMGIAVGGANGLVVPVIRDAHTLSYAELEGRIADFGRRARDGQLKLDELTGGSFSITNGGVYGSLMSTPILNPPQSGILGMHKIQDRPMAINGQVVIRPMMYVALSYDHRIVDGKEAVSFLVRVKDGVEDPRRLLLDL
jgi:2-oxoglutarate dehydrogenase E2 component (dihydrolipoamide succinyltransferase)